ncbi:hypothetical protein MASR1M36_15410 [Candidatus Cloacimonadaceae bacterium]
MSQGELVFNPFSSRLSAKSLLILCMLLYALLEFYTISYSLNTYAFLGATALCLVFVLAFPRQSILDEVNTPSVLYLTSLAAYAAISYFWAINKPETHYYTTLLLRNALIFIMFSALFRDQAIRHKIHYLFTLVLIAYLLTALWEITTKQHLPVSKLYGKDSFVPTGPFYGENLLAAFILPLLPYLIFLPKVLPGKLTRVFSQLLSLACLLIVTLQGARIALLAVAAMLVWLAVWHASWKSRLLSILLVALLGSALSFFAGPFMRLGIAIARREIVSLSSEQVSSRLSSMQIRRQLITESLEILESSHFFGVGAGNFERHMDTDRLYRTAGIINPHNYFLELMGNFGLVFLLFFLFLYGRWLYWLYLAYRHSTNVQTKYYYLMHLVSLLMFIPAASMPSSIKWNHHIWIMFALYDRIANPVNWRKELA